MYVLDGRNPAVCEHLETTFAHLHSKGFRYFKIDFLYAGAYAGVEGLRAGVAAIRAGVRDSYILACGAPLMPLAGLCDGCRIGQDTATPLYNFELGAPSPTIFGSEIEAVARNVAARHFLRPWFQLDPDIALVGGNLSIRQARQLVTVVALSGGPFFASDDLARISAERLALLTNPDVVALAGGAPAVPDWEPQENEVPPSVWRVGEKVIGIFNWTDLERHLDVPVPGRHHVRDVWAQSDAGTVSECLRLDLEPSAVRLFQLDPA
jgi:alpha-galactosidase